jgi:hypothetical protein
LIYITQVLIGLKPSKLSDEGTCTAKNSPRFTVESLENDIGGVMAGHAVAFTASVEARAEEHFIFMQWCGPLFVLPFFKDVSM